MTTDEHDDSAVHGLLATAFDEDIPLVNVVPGAVEGYRRHRRRTRVLGAAGGALAVAGVIAMGTTMTFGGRASGDQSATTGGRASAADKCKVPESVAEQAGWDAAMVRTVTENCTTNVALIEHAIPGAKVTPGSMNPANTPALQGSKTSSPGPTGLRYYPVIAYDITVHGRTVPLNLMVPTLSHDEGCAQGCTATTLSGGMPAKEYSGPEGGVENRRIDVVLALPSGGEVFYASVIYAPGAREAFDFRAFSHSPDFATLVNGTVGLLRGEKYPGYGYLPVG